MGRAWLGPRVAAWLVWLLLGLSLAYWGSRWWGHGPQVSLPAPESAPRQADAAAVARALGAGGETALAPQNPKLAEASPYALVGVATDAQGQGVALLSLDGQPPQAVRVGASLPDGWVLRSLARREAVLAPAQGGAGVLRLTLPEPTSAPGVGQERTD